MELFSHEELPSLAYELPEEVLKYKMCGDFAGARAAIARWLERPVAEGMKARLRLERMMLDQLPADFPYTASQAIALMREQVPDFNRTDLDRLDREGLAEWIYLDGEKHYIHNLVRNVIQEDAEIARRAAAEKQKRLTAEPCAPERMKENGPAQAISGAAAQKDAAPDGITDDRCRDRAALKEEIRRLCTQGRSRWRFRLRTSIRLKDAYFYPGIRLKAHLPLPAELYQTAEVKLLAHAGQQSAALCPAADVAVDPPDSPYRAICFVQTLQENREFFAEYEYTVTTVYRDLWSGMPYGMPEDGGSSKGSSLEDGGSPKESSSKDGGLLGEREAAAGCAVWGDASAAADPSCLGEQYPHIRFSPYLRALAAELTAGADTPLEKARRIYDYITTKVKYSFMRSYFLIPDIAEYCARNLRGDCGVQALLFITLCRICGVPAKWQSGLYFGGRDMVGPHDWAMFYAEPYGWLFADPSIGGGAFQAGDEARRRFYFGNLDPFRMAANHAFQQPYAEAKRFLADDPYDNQSGELESDERGFGEREIVTEKRLVWAERLE